MKKAIHRERTDVNLQAYRSVYRFILSLGIVIVLVVSLRTKATAADSAGNSAAPAIKTVPGMPPVIDPNNLYSETQAGKLSPSVKGALPRIYVPNRQSNDVTVIDPATLKAVDRYAVGINPQHVVPS